MLEKVCGHSILLVHFVLGSTEIASFSPFKSHAKKKKRDEAVSLQPGRLGRYFPPFPFTFNDSESNHLRHLRPHHRSVRRRFTSRRRLQRRHRKPGRVNCGYTVPKMHGRAQICHRFQRADGTECLLGAKSASMQCVHRDVPQHALEIVGWSQKCE